MCNSKICRKSRVLLRCQLMKCQLFVIENIKKNKHWCSQSSKIVSQKTHFGNLIYILASKQCNLDIFQITEKNNKLNINNFLTSFWHINWLFINWHGKRTRLMYLPLFNYGHFLLCLWTIWNIFGPPTSSLHVVIERPPKGWIWRTF